MSDSKAPFSKFKVRSIRFDRWHFDVSVTGERKRGIPDNIIEERRQFIEDAIREKLERAGRPAEKEQG